MSIFPTTEAGTEGFTIDLFHRESPHSPSYDSTLKPWQHSVNSLRRSFNRLNHLTRIAYTTQSPAADVISDSGEFFVKFSIGTPQVPILATFDTASDLIWTQCQPCLKCFKQTYPIFTPSRSSTYRRLACDSFLCKAFPAAICDKASKSCIYSESYADGSFSSGDFVTETITLGSTNGTKISIPGVAIGCGHKNGGAFSLGDSGIAGFASGKVSFISQLGSSGQGKFSYCLVSFLSETSNLSRLHFGNDADVFGKGVVSTPIFLNRNETLYYLTLVEIGVGNQRFGFYDPSAPNAAEEANIIIDSGTTLTFLPSKLYNDLETAIASRIKLKRIKDPQGVLNLCYDSPKDIQTPIITFHFKGAYVELNTLNTFVRTSENALCFAFAPTKGTPIYGNLAQVNFLIGYDLNKKTVSFKATDCSKS
ncbi:aspartic ase CDR1-like [Olea europaea subsp. europaea]|uniref:Aspartic ase CDR1-like n=1 Tax=Olea europaea subsp. europaea TaxID=158383 RepID=A0A8S0Q261_OLEEU|nr:aspartic ase CDR1-like [Olea europaea subsp. europaea]